MGERIAVIPAKASSIRVPLKNFREFHNGQSLLDLLVSRLTASGFTRDTIYVSCEDASRTGDYRLIVRERGLASNDYPYGEVFQRVCAQAWCEHGDVCDIVWAQACDPLFDEYDRCLHLWDNRSKGYDSLAVRRPFRGYLMDATSRPMGWGFGQWHIKSQILPKHYTFPFTLSILRPQTVLNCSYMVGRDVLWVDAHGPHIDIDTLTDFEVARGYYAKLHTPVEEAQ